MASIITSLPDHVRDYIEEEIASGPFESEAAVITRAVEHQIDRGYRWEEDEDLLEAIAQVDRGETRPLTEDLMRGLADRAREQSRAGHTVKPDVTY